MTVDLSTLKVNDVIELRDGSRHVVTESRKRDPGYTVTCATIRAYRDGHESHFWWHNADGIMLRGDESPGDIVRIYSPEVARHLPATLYTELKEGLEQAVEHAKYADFATKVSSVESPSHYNTGKIEVIDAIEDWKLDFCLGNCVKYVARAGKKDPAKYEEDLKKAIWYLNRAIAAKKG